MTRLPILLLALVVAHSSIAGTVDTNEFNTVMMWNTFKITNPAQKALGTGFLISKPIQDSDRRLKVLVTADHVFASNPTELVLVNSRTMSTNGTWIVRPVPLKIRDKGRPLWTKSPSADVAAIYCGVPDPTVNIGLELLADDPFLLDYGLHPGDTVFVLGYPFGVAGPDEFPILQPGVISSYPLAPTSRHPTINIAFSVFPGNSGGPVYLVSHGRLFGTTVRFDRVDRSIVGLVIGARQALESIESKRSTSSEEVTENRTTKTSLDLAVVVQASVIRELVEKMPVP